MQDRAVVLYGSHARGDADAWSDVDILVIGPTEEVPEAVLARHRDCGHPIRVSHYTWNELESMSRVGSLFLHHLAAEARPLLFEGDGSERYEALATGIPAYHHARRDIRAFRAGVEDVRSGLKIGSPPPFEMAVIGGIARHWSVLACYLAGEPTFGRRSLKRASELMGASDLSDLLVLAHRYRLFEEQQCPPPPEVDRRDVLETVEACEFLLNRTKERLDADN